MPVIFYARVSTAEQRLDHQFAQAQAEAMKEAQKAGIEAAMREVGKYLGKKPSYSRAVLSTVQKVLVIGAGASVVARETGLSRQTVLRIKADPIAAEAALVRWGL